MKILSVRVVSKLWLFFRTGYGLYLVFPIGLISNGALLYYQYVKNTPILADLFPTFESFMGVGFTGIIALGVLLGAIHFTLFYRFEQRETARNTEYMINSEALYSAMVRIAEQVGAGDSPEVEKLRKLRSRGA